MKIGILGSGTVGQTIGAKVAELGHDVVVGTRSPAKLAEWLRSVKAKAGTFAEAAHSGELIFNCISGDGTLAALNLAGADNLADKILVDISNPLDFSKGMPPSLLVSNTDSLGEQIQRAFPRLRVVKTLNTLSASLMVNPRSLGGGSHSIFVSGNDAGAKDSVRALLRDWFGWSDIVDLGDITTARGPEMLVPLWVRLMVALGGPNFNFKIVR